MQLSLLSDLPVTPQAVSEPPRQPSLYPDTLPSMPRGATVTSLPAAADSSKDPAAFKTIREVAELLGVAPYVLRFWEGEFPQLHPAKSRGGRRYYRPEDIDTLQRIRHLLYERGYTIKGARKALSLPDDPADGGTMPSVAVLVPAATPKSPITHKQRTQLATIRSELLSLRSQLLPHL